MVPDEFGAIIPTREETYTFLRQFFGEIFTTFPDEFVHLGGDEISYYCWQEICLPSFSFSVSKQQTSIKHLCLMVQQGKTSGSQSVYGGKRLGSRLYKIGAVLL